jgi:putative MATE family efflux protein|tara:strand:+ start:157 stop:1512 length:1356 start_codon:yes stop_codon:yes gene_type:complete
VDLLKDNIPKLVKKLAIPASIGTLFQTLYNIVDTFYAGKISPEALSALGKSFPIYFTIIAASIGVTVAGTSLIGNSIGEKNEKKTLYYFTHIIIYGIFISIIISLFGLNYSENIFYIMGSTKEVVDLGLEYTNIIFYGSIIFISVVSLNSLLHAEGDTKTYRNVLILSFFLNIILNPILIFGFLFIPAMGVKGIGISTLISQLLCFIIIFKKILSNDRIKHLNKEYYLLKFAYFKNIFFQSMPIIISICAYSFASGIVFTYLGQEGEFATAGYGAASRFEQILFLPVLGINTAIISIIAQNYGAMNFNRIRETFFTAIKYALSIMLFASLLVFLLADIVTSLFSNNSEVIDYGSRYLRISAIVLPAYPLFFISNGFFMALKKAENAMISNLIRNLLLPIFVFYLAVYLSADFNTFFWIWVSFNWSYSLIYLLIVLYYLKNHLDKSRAILYP